MTQVKLTTEERQLAEKAAKALLSMCKWEKMPEGHGYWDEIHAKLFNVSKHGTTDGKPWVEPELTDEDAKQRKLVMCRHSDAYPWAGPLVLIRVTSGVLRHIAEHSPGHICFYNEARRATAEEIEAANGNR